MGTLKRAQLGYREGGEGFHAVMNLKYLIYESGLRLRVLKVTEELDHFKNPRDCENQTEEQAQRSSDRCFCICSFICFPQPRA